VPACTQVEMLVSRACEPISGSILCTGEEIGFYLCLLSRVFLRTARHRPISSTLPFPRWTVIGSVIRIVSWVRCFGFFSGSLSSDRVLRKHGWKNIAAVRVWIAFYCKPIPPTIVIIFVLVDQTSYCWRGILHTVILIGLVKLIAVRETHLY